MTTDMSLDEPCDTDIDTLCKVMTCQGFVYASGEKTKKLIQQQGLDALEDITAFANSWSNLPLDNYMADGGKYRRRRHATFSALPSSNKSHLESHQPHFQSLAYNHLNGDVARHYEPIEQSVLNGKSLPSILTLCCEIFGRLSPHSMWHIEVHQFRIEAASGERAMPTPEGTHRDGVSFVMMLMIGRVNVVNGTTSIYNLEKRQLDEFTLLDPLDMAIVNDERVFHGVTSIIQSDVGKEAYRDVLVVTFHRKN